MEQTGKELRLFLQKKLSEIPQNKGIKLSERNLTDEAGKIKGRGLMTLPEIRKCGSLPLIQPLRNT